MPVYHLWHDEGGLELAIEAKSEIAARLHVTRAMHCESIGAQELASLVLKGVKVESANKEQDAAQAELRG